MMPRGMRIGAAAPMSIAAYERESWKLDAACAADPEPFAREAWPPTALERAQAICQACPVVSECAALAAALRPLWGVWAGVEWHGVGRSQSGSPIGGAGNG